MHRVAITTGADRSGILEDQARAARLDPVLLPCIEVSPAVSDLLDRARQLAARADWLVVTSPRTVATLWPQGGMPPVPVAAVGEATAHAVASAGSEAALVGASGAEALVAQLAGLVGDGSVFFPHASRADTSIVMRLRGHGAEVETLAVYETTPVAPRPDPVEAAVFGSPSAVKGWCLSRTLDDLVLAAIGETTAEALGRAGKFPDVIPLRPDFETLFDLLAQHLRQRSPV